MSVQEEKLRAIADAIREKEGTKGPIAAKEFARRILALPVGLMDVGAGELLSGTQEENLSKIADAIRAKEGSSEPIPASAFAERILALKAQKPSHDLPAGYTELEYIISNSAAYIDSGLRPTTSLKTFVDVEVVSTASGSVTFVNSYYSATVSGSAYYFVYRLSYMGSSKSFQANLGRVRTTVGIAATAFTLPTVSEERVFLGLNTASKTAEINGESASNTNANAASVFHASMPTIQLFQGNTSATIKYYSAQMYSGTTLSRDFIPCKNPDGEVGMYDLVGKKFYGSAATSYSFVAGPAL